MKILSDVWDRTTLILCYVLILEGVESACLQHVMRTENSQKLLCLKNLTTGKFFRLLENGIKVVCNKSKSSSFFLIEFSV